MTGGEILHLGYFKNGHGEVCGRSLRLPDRGLAGPGPGSRRPARGWNHFASLSPLIADLSILGRVIKLTCSVRDVFSVRIS